MKAKGSTLIPILTIAGSDCSGGAGIQADLKTFCAHNLFGMSVILSVVAENTQKVHSVHNIPEDIVNDQILSIFEDIIPKATKIGMIGSGNLMHCVAKNIQLYKPSNIVIDPVMFAKNGHALMPIEYCELFKELILPLADILTPNIPEARALCGFDIINQDDMIKAAKQLCKLGAKSVLIKGGHMQDNADDIFFDGNNIHILTAEKIETKNTHGTGCTLSSAIASNLALGNNLLESIHNAKEYISKAIYYSLNLGHGFGPLNHLYNFIKPESL